MLIKFTPREIYALPRRTFARSIARAPAGRRLQVLSSFELNFEGRPAQTPRCHYLLTYPTTAHF